MRQKRQTDSEKVLPILIPVLGDRLARAIIEFRDTVKKEPLTEYAAELQVREYLKCGDPIAAAEMQILRSWRAIKSDWFFNEKRKDEKNAPRRSNDMADFAADLMGRYDDRAITGTH